MSSCSSYNNGLPTLSPARRAELALCGVTVIWGTTFTLVKAALADISTVLFLAIRFSAAALMLAVIFRGPLSARPPDARRGVAGGFAAGLCLSAAYFLQTSGLRFTTATHSAFLTSLCVVLVPLLAIIVYQTVPRWMEGLGVAMALLGTALLVSPFDGAGFNFGDAMTIGCALAFACHILVMGAFAPRADFARLSVLQVATVGGLGWITFWWIEPVHLRWSAALVSALAVTSVLCTALAFTVQAWAQRHTTSTRAALIFSLEPVSAAATSYLVDGERLSVPALAGAALILAGVVGVESRPAPRRT
jgi:drug/metabolite transporter (DMT)-like permease